MAQGEEKEESEEEAEQATEKKFGKGANECRRCGRQQGLVRRYDIYLCRQCFREMAPTMGFEKYR